jgi:hypothetical protein
MVFKTLAARTVDEKRGMLVCMYVYFAFVPHAFVCVDVYVCTWDRVSLLASDLDSVARKVRMRTFEWNADSVLRLGIYVYLNMCVFWLIVSHNVDSECVCIYMICLLSCIYRYIM